MSPRANAHNQDHAAFDSLQGTMHACSKAADCRKKNGWIEAGSCRARSRYGYKALSQPVSKLCP